MVTKTIQNKKTAPMPLLRVPKLPGGWRRHIRIEKARIRREAENQQEAQERIQELYTRISSRPKS